MTLTELQYSILVRINFTGYKLIYLYDTFTGSLTLGVPRAHFWPISPLIYYGQKKRALLGLKKTLYV